MKAKIEAEADALLAAANDNTPPKARIRFRGGRPALNWLRRQDERAAAALWLVARRHLPEAANDNLSDAKGMGVERRKNGKPRGTDADPRSLEAYLKLPSEKPRLGDADATPGPLRGWWSDTIVVKSQEWTHPEAEFTESTRMSWHPPGIAHGAIFMGAIGGLGQAKQGKHRGDARRVDEPDLPAMPEAVAKTVEAVLARADLAGVGRALGYRGGYADRQGKKAMLEAGRWALKTIAA